MQEGQEDLIIKTLKPVSEIAELCHEANRAYCRIIGDDSQPLWADAPDWQKNSAIDGVKSVIESWDNDGTGLNPEKQHNKWLSQKLHDGWRYGLVKDAVAKTHPCLLPYDELPVEQQIKDTLFAQVVFVFLMF